MASEARQRIEKFMASQHPWMRNMWATLGEEAKEQSAAEAARLAEGARRFLKACSVEAYEAASGSRVVIRLRVKSKGCRPASVRPTGLSLLMCAAGPTSPEIRIGEHPVQIIRESAIAEMELELGAEAEAMVRRAVDALRRGAAGQASAASAKAALSRDRAMAARRKAALQRLAEEFRRFEFTEEEVTEAWRLSQVERVQAT